MVYGRYNYSIHGLYKPMGRVNGLVLGENFNRKAPYWMGKSMVSGRFSLKPIHWQSRWVFMTARFHDGNFWGKDSLGGKKLAMGIARWLHQAECGYDKTSENIDVTINNWDLARVLMINGRGCGYHPSHLSSSCKKQGWNWVIIWLITSNDFRESPMLHMFVAYIKWNTELFLVKSPCLAIFQRIICSSSTFSCWTPMWLCWWSPHVSRGVGKCPVVWILNISFKYRLDIKRNLQ